MKTHLAWRWEPESLAGVPPTLRANQANVALKEWGNEQPQFSCFPTRAAVGLRNSSRVVVRRQAGWVVAPFTIGGDSPGLTALCIIWSPHGKQLWWHTGTLSYFLTHTIILQPCPHMSAGCQSARILFNVRPDLNQKQTSSLSVFSIYYWCRSTLFSPTFYLLQHSRFSLFLSPRSPLAPRCFPLIHSLKFEGRGGGAEWIPHSLIFVDVFLGAAYCRLGSQVTHRRGVERMKERKNEVKMKSCTMSQKSSLREL